jgi:hypothetical protein
MEGDLPLIRLVMVLGQHTRRADDTEQALQMRSYPEGDKRHIRCYCRMVLQGVIGKGVIFWDLAAGPEGGVTRISNSGNLDYEFKFQLLFEGGS